MPAWRYSHLKRAYHYKLPEDFHYKTCLETSVTRPAWRYSHLKTACHYNCLRTSVTRPTFLALYTWTLKGHHDQNLERKEKDLLAIEKGRVHRKIQNREQDKADKLIHHTGLWVIKTSCLSAKNTAVMLCIVMCFTWNHLHNHQQIKHTGTASVFNK